MASAFGMGQGSPTGSRRQRTSVTPSEHRRRGSFSFSMGATSAGTTSPRRVVQLVTEQPGQLVTVNVGGTIFTMTRRLFRGLEGTRLHEMVVDAPSRGPRGCPRDVNGTVFVDRDPVCFGAVLRYLRTNVVHVSDPSLLPIVRSEFQYYGLADAFDRPGVAIEAPGRGGTCCEGGEDLSGVFVKTSTYIRAFVPVLGDERSSSVCPACRLTSLPTCVTLAPETPQPREQCSASFDLC